MDEQPSRLAWFLRLGSGLGPRWELGFNLTAYSRAWATSPDSAPTIRAYATPYVNQPWEGCLWVVWVDVWDWDACPAEVWEASVGHVYADYALFTWINYYFWNQEYFNPGVPAAHIATSQDPWNCPWTGPHVHETHVPGVARTERNLNHFPPYSPCPPDCLYYNTNGDNWTREFWWGW